MISWGSFSEEKPIRLWSLPPLFSLVMRFKVKISSESHHTELPIFIVTLADEVLYDTNVYGGYLLIYIGEVA
jgi:hypothetical protein